MTQVFKERMNNFLKMQKCYSKYEIKFSLGCNTYYSFQTLNSMLKAPQ